MGWWRQVGPTDLDYAWTEDRDPRLDCTCVQFGEQQEDCASHGNPLVLCEIWSKDLNRRHYRVVLYGGALWGQYIMVSFDQVRFWTIDIIDYIPDAATTTSKQIGRRLTRKSTYKIQSYDIATDCLQATISNTVIEN